MTLPIKKKQKISEDIISQIKKVQFQNATGLTLLFLLKSFNVDLILSKPMPLESFDQATTMNSSPPDLTTSETPLVA